MRLPYLQVTQEAWTSARMLAGVLGIKRREALGLILDLWAWGLYLGPSDQPPTGVCDSPRAVTLMAGALEWDGDANDLIAALAEIGLLEILPAGVRVRGLKRYHEAFERARKERERKAKWKEGRGKDAEETRKERGTDAEREGKKQTQKKTQTQTHIEAVAPASPPPALLLSAEVSDTRPTQMLAEWNGAASGNIPKAQASPDRTEKLKRWLKGKSLEEWRLLVARVNASPLLRGDKGEWRATLDWVLKPSNLAKILDGNYDDPTRSPARNAAPSAPCAVPECQNPSATALPDGHRVCGFHNDKSNSWWHIAAPNPEDRAWEAADWEPFCLWLTERLAS